MLYLIFGAVIILSTIVYALFFMFLPEWIGITGQVALNNEKSHGGHEVEQDAFSKVFDEAR